MGLITLLLLLAFTALSFSKTLEKKPAALEKFVAKITPYLDLVAFWGVIYGGIAAIFTLMLHYSSFEMLVRLASNLLIVFMALPISFDKLVGKHEAKINPAIMDELKSFVNWMERQEKIFGYVGAVMAVLLFGLVFR